jgi:TonB family protein
MRQSIAVEKRPPGWPSHPVAVASLCLAALCLAAVVYVSTAWAQGTPTPSDGDKPCPVRESTVVVQFSIDREGRVLDARVVQSSGYPRLDRSAVDVVKRASPLPPPPPDLISQQRLTFQQPVTYRVPRCRK